MSGNVYKGGGGSTVAHRLSMTLFGKQMVRGRASPWVARPLIGQGASHYKELPPLKIPGYGPARDTSTTVINGMRSI